MHLKQQKRDKTRSYFLYNCTKHIITIFVVWQVRSLPDRDKKPLFKLHLKGLEHSNGQKKKKRRRVEGRTTINQPMNMCWLWKEADFTWRRRDPKQETTWDTVRISD